MEPKFNTSFIPKKSLKADVVGGYAGENSYVKRRTVRGPGFFLVLLIFIATVSASIGMFVLIKSVESNIQTKTKTLNSQKDLFNKDDIDMLVETQTHLNSAEKILENHVAVTQLFDLLEDITLKNVQYTELEYEDKEGKNIVTITGVANGFREVALQTSEYRTKSKLNNGLRNPILKEIERNHEDKSVNFTVEVLVDKILVSFSDAIKNGRRNQSKLQTNTITKTPEDTEIDVKNITESNL